MESSIYTQVPNNPKMPAAAWAQDTSMLKAKTKVRITFPENTKNAKILQMAEINAPGGLTIEFKLPFPMVKSSITKLAETITQTGGTVEIQE